MLSAYLRQLFIAGAFRGDSEEQAFFVRCDAELNHRRIVDSGQMIAEIGVAPVARGLAPIRHSNISDLPAPFKP